VVVSIGIVVFFIYDASTYREDPSYSDIQVSELALSPRIGGPKNLPIAEVQLDDEDTAQMQMQKEKPKLVILGGGWGGVALLKTLNPEQYHVTLVSPNN
jgi:NADH dehydrogenase